MKRHALSQRESLQTFDRLVDRLAEMSADGSSVTITAEEALSLFVVNECMAEMSREYALLVARYQFVLSEVTGGVN